MYNVSRQRIWGRGYDQQVFLVEISVDPSIVYVLIGMNTEDALWRYKYVHFNPFLVFLSKFN